MKSYQSEIERILAELPDAEIERLAGVLEWVKPSKKALSFDCSESVFKVRALGYRGGGSRGIVVTGKSIITGGDEDVIFEWLPDDVIPMAHAKAAFAIFLALVKRDLPEIELP